MGGRTGGATLREERSLLDGNNLSPSANEVAVWCRTHSAASSAFYRLSERGCSTTRTPPHWHKSVSVGISGVWMMSFHTIVVLDLQTATTMLQEATGKGRSTWTTGVCVCVCVYSDKVNPVGSHVRVWLWSFSFLWFCLITQSFVLQKNVFELFLSGFLHCYSFHVFK